MNWLERTITQAFPCRYGNGVAHVM